MAWGLLNMRSLHGLMIGDGGSAPAPLALPRGISGKRKDQEKDKARDADV